jgi:hypothetical protein
MSAQRWALMRALSRLAGSGDEQVWDGALLKRPESRSSRREEQRSVRLPNNLPGGDVGHRNMRKHYAQLCVCGIHQLILIELHE